MRFTHYFLAACVSAFISCAHAASIKDNAEAAANSVVAKAMLDDFSKTYAIAKICNHRTEAVIQYYTSEYRRVLRNESPGKMKDEDLNYQVGLVSVSAQLFAKQFEGKKFTPQQCANVRTEIDQLIPRGYDQN
ncbi:MAG: hypothetical protein AB1482_04825 [Pseudomonadota bacterium]